MRTRKTTLPVKYHDAVVDSIVACGPIEKTVSRVTEHWDAGADHVCIQVLAPGADLEINRLRWRELAEAFGLSAS